MHRFILFVLLGLLSSCSFFTSQEEKTQQLVNEKLKAIDWNSVNSYPLFENCDESVSKAMQRECFESELLTHCKKSLREFEYTFDKTIDPNILVDFLVDKDGRISVTNIQKDTAIATQMPKFDEIIGQSLKNLPPLAPALKEGMPVNIKFRIPIVLQSKN